MAYDKNVYILGAGFSQPAGAPIMEKFWEQAYEYYERPHNGFESEEKKRFERVVEYSKSLTPILAKAEIRLEHIEDLCNLMEVQVDGKMEPEGLRDDFIYIVARTLELSTNIPWVTYDIADGQPIIFYVDAINTLPGRNDDRPLQLPSSKLFFSCVTKPTRIWLYHLFASMFHYDMEKHDAVISFNYDLTLDRAFLDVGLRPDYCVGFEDRRDKALLSHGHERVKLLKLHGSLNWFRCSSQKCRHEFINTDRHLPENRPQSLLNVACPKCNEGGQNLIALPSWDKSRNRDSFATLWKHAIEELRDARRIIIIGYSLPDSDTLFKHVLLHGFNHPGPVDWLIVDPNGGVHAKYGKLFSGDISEEGFGFGTYEGLQRIMKFTNRQVDYYIPPPKPYAP